MTNSFFAPGEVMLRRFVVGHVTQGERHILARPLLMNRGENPGGGLDSSVHDQLRYARFQMSDGTAESGARLLMPETMRLRQAPAIHATGRQYIDLSWFTEEFGDTQIVSHGGTTNGALRLRRPHGA